MSIYDSGAAAFRDTTKWLVAFVPIAAIAAAAVTVGPGVLRAARRAGSLGDFASDQALTLVGIGFVMLGVGAIVWSGAVVLGKQPADLAAVLKDDKRVEKAFGVGVGAPYFFDARKFNEALADLQEAWDNEVADDTDVDDPVKQAEMKAKADHTSATLTRALGTVESLRAWALQGSLKGAFTVFSLCFAGGVVCILGGLITAATALDTSAADVTKPTLVEIRLKKAGETKLTAETGCTTPSDVTFWAVGGTWDEPVLAVEGDGCKFGARWDPDPSLIELRFPATGSEDPSG